MRFAADGARARAVIAPIPFPITHPDQAADAVLSRVGPRTKIAVFSAMTSPTALALPFARLVDELQSRGVDCLVDAAHAVGMLPLDLRSLGAAYVTGDGHKWLCGPKGSAFLFVRRDRQSRIRPLVISHGANDPRTDRSRFRLEFDWTGTVDPTPYLALPAALRFMAEAEPGGWTALMTSNRELALTARLSLCRALGIQPPAPDSMIGSMAALPLPDGLPAEIQKILFDRHRIELPIGPWPVDAAREPGQPPAARLLRISAQRYNRPEQYERLAEALTGLLAS